MPPPEGIRYAGNGRDAIASVMSEEQILAASLLMPLSLFPHHLPSPGIPMKTSVSRERDAWPSLLKGDTKLSLEARQVSVPLYLRAPVLQRSPVWLPRSGHFPHLLIRRPLAAGCAGCVPLNESVSTAAAPMGVPQAVRPRDQKVLPG